MTRAAFYQGSRGPRWSPSEDDRLAELVRAHVSTKAIAAELGRTESSVQNRAYKLGLSLAIGKKPLDRDEARSK